MHFANLQSARNLAFPHLSIASPELAPCRGVLKSRLPDFIGPFPPSLLIRLFNCMLIISVFFEMSTAKCLFFRAFCPYFHQVKHFLYIVHTLSVDFFFPFRVI